MHVDASTVVMYALIGVATGFLSGMFGIGGGPIRIPLLIMAGMPILQAYATNMFSIPFCSATGAYIHRNNITWKVTKPFTAGGITGISVASFFVGIVPATVLAAFLFFASILTTIGLYLRDLNDALYRKMRPTRPALFGGAMGANFISGMGGGSGGTLFAPLLSALNLPMRNAIATSHVACFFSSLFALSIYAYNGIVLIGPGILMSVTGMAGSFVGSSVSLRTNTATLRAELAILVVALAASVVYRTYG